ncbi:hypothetical protein [Bacillus sp. M6-12]|nr:hypothetical protein [Bacillus sp. M6-12]
MDKDKVPFFSNEFLDDLAREINDQFGFPNKLDKKVTSEKNDKDEGHG